MTQGEHTMTQPTHEDATLLVQLAQWMTASGAADDANWLFGNPDVKDYKTFIEKNPPGSMDFGRVSKVCAVFETIGTLHKHGLINEELLFDWLAVSLIWNVAAPFALGQRAAVGEPRLYENFEALAKASQS
jgi:hypothetical protein